MAVTEDGARAAIEKLGGRLTPEQVAAIDDRERTLYGGGEVRSPTPTRSTRPWSGSSTAVCSPGYVRRFVETAAPLIGLRLEGDPGGVFGLEPERPRRAADVLHAAERRAGRRRERPHAADALLGAMEAYPEEIRGRLTLHRPESDDSAIWMHPGEPVFDRFRAVLLSLRGDEARRGAIFVDPHAEAALPLPPHRGCRWHAARGAGGRWSRIA